MKKTAKITLFSILAAIGLVFSIVGGLSTYSRQKKVYAETQATITVIDEYYDMLANALEGETKHKVYVDYTVDGQEYSNIEFGAYDPSMKENDTVTVKYNVDDPADISTPPSVTLPLVSLGVGILLLAIGVIFMIKAVKAKSAQE